MELNATAFGYLTLLFIVIASFAIGLKLVYERKHETSDRAGQPLTTQKAGCSDFFCPATHQMVDTVSDVRPYAAHLGYQRLGLFRNQRYGSSSERTIRLSLMIGPPTS